MTRTKPSEIRQMKWTSQDITRITEQENGSHSKTNMQAYILLNPTFSFTTGFRTGSD